MARSVGSLLAFMQMDADQFDASIRQSEARLKSGTARMNRTLIAFERRVEGRMRSIGRTLTRGLGAFAGIAVGQQAVSGFARFEAQLDELSAITGATGAQLKFLERSAVDLAGSTTLSATEILRGYKLVASAKPELLANSRALAAVTKETIALSEAAGIGLDEAAKAVGGSLNQFSAGAEQAGRFVNVLAAGSQKGAAEVPFLTAALRQSGVVAAQSKLSFEETVAALETLAKGGLQAEQAGTGLRNVLLRLQQDTIEARFNPAVVGAVQALRNLSAENLTAAQRIKLFGLENVTAAGILLENVDAYEKLIRAISGTNTAYEQQKTRTDNLLGVWNRSINALGRLANALLQIVNPAIRVGLSLLADSFNYLAARIETATDAAGKLVSTVRLSILSDEIKDLEGDLKVVNAQLERARDRLARFTDESGFPVTEEFERVNAEVTKLTEQQKRLQDQLRRTRRAALDLAGGAGAGSAKSILPSFDQFLNDLGVKPGGTGNGGGVKNRLPFGDRVPLPSGRLPDSAFASAVLGRPGAGLDDAEERFSDFFLSTQSRFEQFEEVGRMVFDNLGSALEDFIRTGEFRFSQFIASLSSMLLSSALSSVFSKLGSGLFGNLFGGAAAPSATNLPLRLNLSGVAGRAGGGTVGGGRPYVVGEHGPELFVPNISGQIVTSEQLRAGGGAPVQVFVSTPDAQSFRDNSASIGRAVGMATRRARFA